MSCSPLATSSGQVFRGLLCQQMPAIISSRHKDVSDNTSLSAVLLMLHCHCR